MGLADALAQAAPPARPQRPVDVPKGWEPGVRYSAAKGEGTIVTDALAGEPTAAIWAELIADWGLDATLLEIVDGSIELIGWDSPIKGTDQRQRLKRYKARLRRRDVSNSIGRADIEALCRQAMKRKPRKAPVIDVVDRALVVAFSDWQLGKGEGDGTAGTVDRIIASIDATVARIAELKRMKRPVGAVYLVGMGDLVEQCGGHYPSQAFTTDLNRREQMRIARRLVLRAVDLLVDRTDCRIVLTGVAGNHGENREDGKAITDPTDNDDLAVIEQVAEVMASNSDRYGDRVSSFLPSMLSMCLDIAGVPVGFAHGHKAGSGATPEAKLAKWWTGQVMGYQPVADARILVTGHYHHLALSESTGRTWMQCPAMDPGSGWWTESTGQSSPSGMLTFVADATTARGWTDLAVL